MVSSSAYNSSKILFTSSFLILFFSSEVFLALSIDFCEYSFSIFNLACSACSTIKRSACFSLTITWVPAFNAASLSLNIFFITSESAPSSIAFKYSRFNLLNSISVLPKSCCFWLFKSSKAFSFWISMALNSLSLPSNLDNSNLSF